MTQTVNSTVKRSLVFSKVSRSTDIVEQRYGSTVMSVGLKAVKILKEILLP